jgi:hypothetical protein
MDSTIDTVVPVTLPLTAVIPISSSIRLCSTSTGRSRSRSRVASLDSTALG